jgi:hypothetical protein
LVSKPKKFEKLQEYPESGSPWFLWGAVMTEEEELRAEKPSDV